MLLRAGLTYGLIQFNNLESMIALRSEIEQHLSEN